MEPIAPFELSQLERRWIESRSGGSFENLFQSAIDRINAAEGVVARGVLIVEAEPLAFAAAFFAAAYLQLPLVLANPNWQAQEWSEVAAQLNPALIFGTAPLATVARDLSCRAPQAGSILIPTGGSSGGVKFAVHGWASLSVACQGLRAFLGAGPINSFCVLPLYHVSGLMQLLRSFLSGGHVILGDCSALASAVPGLCFSLVPTQLQRLLQQAQALSVLKSARVIFIGGAALSSDLAARARKLQLPLVLSYGMTESAAMVAVRPVADFFSKPGMSSAVSLPHVEIDILDHKGTRCRLNEVGTIRIQSRSLFKGYHGKIPLEISAGYLTDDLGYLDADGYLSVIGRSDRLIISGGEKIDPLEVERAILATNLASEVLALGCFDAEWGQRLVVFYVPTSRSIMTEEWQQHLRPRLVAHKLPKQWIPVDVLPLDEKGKVQLHKIEQLIATHI